jgi:hypothetical protein
MWEIVSFACTCASNAFLKLPLILSNRFASLIRSNGYATPGSGSISKKFRFLSSSLLVRSKATCLAWYLKKKIEKNIVVTIKEKIIVLE